MLSTFIARTKLQIMYMYHIKCVVFDEHMMIQLLMSVTIACQRAISDHYLQSRAAACCVLILLPTSEPAYCTVGICQSSAEKLGDNRNIKQNMQAINKIER